jgi:hypothetical protein
MAAGYQNLFLEQGTTFTISLTLDDVYGNNYDLSNANCYSQIRKSYYSANSTAIFTTSVDASNSTISLSLDSRQTANISTGRYVYDTIVSYAGAQGQANTIVRVLEGIVDVLPSVTR